MVPAEWQGTTSSSAECLLSAWFGKTTRLLPAKWESAGLPAEWKSESLPAKLEPAGLLAE